MANAVVEQLLNVVRMLNAELTSTLHVAGRIGGTKQPTPLDVQKAIFEQMTCLNGTLEGILALLKSGPNPILTVATGIPGTFLALQLEVSKGRIERGGLRAIKRNIRKLNSHIYHSKPSTDPDPSSPFHGHSVHSAAAS